MSRGLGRREGDTWRRSAYGSNAVGGVAPFASRLIHANYADRGIAIATGVSGWEDVVGNRDFVQADTTKQPAYGVFTAQPALVFDGVNDFMASPAVNLAAYGAVTVAFAFSYTAAGLVAIMETSAVYSSNVGAFIVAGNGGTVTPSYYAGGAVQSRGFACSNGVHRIIFTLDTTQVGTITACYLDGVSVGATPAGASAPLGNYATYIGMRAGTSLPWAGKIGDSLMYSGTMTAGEVASVDAFLASRCT